MRPIDAEHLKRWIIARWEKTAPTSPYPLRAIDIIDQIDREDTIDAVQTVRCKDCRWHEQELPGMVFCPNTVGGWVEDNWFCKGGERKDDE